jgi:hypothetical protein
VFAVKVMAATAEVACRVVVQVAGEITVSSGMETSQCFMSRNLGSRRIVFGCRATYSQDDAISLQTSGGFDVVGFAAYVSG